MNTKGNRKGKVVVISGPSGVGKSTICREIVKKLDNVCLSVSATTRPRAENEADGKDYHFLTKSEFKEKIDAGQFLEYAEVFGNFYGTPKDKVRQNLKAGKTVILEIDVQGGAQIKTAFPDAVMIFIMPPDHGELAKRMGLRAREEPQTAEKRLKKAGSEIAAANRCYDYKVVNDNLQDTVNEVIKIISTAE